MYHYYEDKIRQLGCELIEVDILRHPFKSIRTISRQMKACDLFCGWMYYSNLLSYYIAKFLSSEKLIWFVRHADLSRENNNSRTLFVNRICGKKSSSKNIKMIVYNGNLARKIHEDSGYDKTKSYVVNNGCDLDFYNFNPDSKQKVSSELGISANSTVLLSVARDNKIKDVPLFISALAQIKKEHTDVVGLMCGRGIDENNSELLDIIKQNGLILGKDIMLLGCRDDLPDLFSACDIYVLHSAGEAFPNALIQAMACGCVCVATDVGDVKNILSQEAIVPPKNIEEMVKKINFMLHLTDEEKAKIRQQNVRDAQENFNIKNVILTYEELFLKM